MQESTALIVAAGVVGVVLGAWLSDLIMTRRERWNLRREVYSRLIENLGEVRDTLARQVEMEARSRVTDSPEVRIRFENEMVAELTRENKIYEQFRLVSSVAPIVVRQDVLEALDRMRDEWFASEDPAYLSRRQSMANDAYSIVVAAARKDLGMGFLRKSPPSARA